MAEMKPLRYKRTKKQREFIAWWNRGTLYEFQENTSEPFYKRAEWNIRWLEMHIQEVTQGAERKLYEITTEKANS